MAFATVSSLGEARVVSRVGSIPFTSIEAYARRYRIEAADAFDAFLDLIKAQDRLYIEIRNDPDGPDLSAEIEPDDDDYVRALLAPQAAPDDD